MSSEDLDNKPDESLEKNLSAIQFTKRISGLLTICIDGIKKMVSSEDPFFSKLNELKSVLEKVKPELDSSSGKAFRQFFDKRIEDEKNIKNEKKELKGMVVSLGDTIKEFVVFSGGVGNNLTEHIDKMRESEVTNEILEIKDQIISEANKIKEETQTLKVELNKYKEKTSELTKRLEQSEADALIDNLTGAFNRNAYNIEIVRFIKEFERYKHPFAIVVLDIDHFKNVNDTYGHAKGDEILKIVAALVKSTIRETDKIFRYGGEEFVIWMPKMETNTAIQASDKIRRVIEGQNWNAIAKGLDITASFGISCVKENDTTTTVFNRADKALYNSKNNGRNQVSFEK
jgi:diguanylate cyclase